MWVSSPQEIERRTKSRNRTVICGTYKYSEGEEKRNEKRETFEKAIVRAGATPPSRVEKVQSRARPSRGARGEENKKKQGLTNVK